MKNTPLKLIAICIFLMTCCKNDDDNNNPIDQLPPATMTGAQTIGCLVNGEPFTDSGIMNNFYQFVDGEYYLAVNWDMNTQNDTHFGQIGFYKTEILEGETYVLNISSHLADNSTEGGAATYATNNVDLSGQYETNANYIGTIHFTRFDTENFIMSGTFEFQAQEIISGKTISITDGRFDLKFTN